jgi:hypothetical protein
MSTNAPQRVPRTGVRNGDAPREKRSELEAWQELNRRYDEDLGEQLDYLKSRIEKLKTASGGVSDPSSLSYTKVWTKPKTSAEANAQIDQLVTEMAQATGWNRSNCRMQVLMQNKALADMAAYPELSAPPGELYPVNDSGMAVDNPVWSKVYPESQPKKPVSNIDPKKLAARQAKERLDELTEQLVKLEPHVSRSAARLRVMAWPANRALVDEAAQDIERG